MAGGGWRVTSVERWKSVKWQRMSEQMSQQLLL